MYASVIIEYSVKKLDKEFIYMIPNDLKDKIKEIDEKAFIIVSHVEEVSGNGFTYSKGMREVLS